jgi:hypothetical protein
MKSQLETSNDYPLIVLEIDGNLRLKGGDGQEVLATSDGQEDLLLEQREDHVYLHSKTNCRVIVPRSSEIRLEAVFGSANIKLIDGDLVANRVDGNLDLRNVGATRLDRVKGNLHARRVSGELDLDTIDGNAYVVDVQGAFNVHSSIGGNLNLEDIEGNATANVGGNLSVRLDPLPGSSYEFKAGGNLACWLSEDASAEVHILQASKFSINYASQNISQHGGVPYSVVFGDGDSSIKLSAGGNMAVSGAPGFSGHAGFGVNVDFKAGEIPEDFSEDIHRQIEAQMEMLERQIEFQMENLSSTLGSVGLSEEAAERISRKAREASARATERAQEKMQRAQEKIQRKIDAARRKAEQKSRSARRAEQRQESRPPGSGFTAPAFTPQEDPVSNEERLMILQMLEEKKITLQEAEQLLAALEGGVDE